MSHAQIGLIDDDRTTARELGTLTRDDGAVLPLVGVAIRARAGALAAETMVEQRFANPFDDPIEVIYTFPLPGECAVRDFELRVGSRVVRGNLAERGAARAQYAQAIKQGHRASLLEQERDNVFTIQVGNVLPGDDVVIRLEYCERLALLADGRAELRLPLVVAPRYMRGNVIDGGQTGSGVELDTDAIPDASRLSPPRLAPGFDPKTALSIEVEVSGRVGDLVSSQHAIQSSIDEDRVRVTLATADARLDRDFVLRWMLRGQGVAAQLVRHGEFAMITLVAPADEGGAAPARDVVFVLDRSGSMRGQKLASASLSCELLLRSLGARDRFRLLAFDDRLEWMSSDAAVADEHGFIRAQQWLSGIGSRGGTEINQALDSALRAFGDNDTREARERIVILLTDGQVGDESGALRIVQNGRAEVRLFTIGVDTAVNDGLLRRLATLGRGSAFFVEPQSGIEEAMRSIARQIGSPVITELAISGARDIAPARLPDLFAGQSVAAFARVDSGGIEVSGRKRDGSAFRASLAPEVSELPAVEQLWARVRIMELENALRVRHEPRLRDEIVALSLRHRVLSRLTAFVAVDESESVVADGSSPRAIVQPMEMPALWEVEALDAPSMPMLFSAMASPSASMAEHIVGEARPSALRRSPRVKAEKPGGFSELASRTLDALRPRRSAVDDKRRAWNALPSELDALRKVVEEMRRVLEGGARPTSDKLRNGLRTVRLIADAADARGAAGLERVLRSGDELSQAIDEGADLLELAGRTQALCDELDALIREVRARVSTGAERQGPFWEKTL